MIPRRILVTRAPQQASELATRLRVEGIEPILIPTIETTSPVSFAPLNAAVRELSSFHWLLFTSANAVEVFAKRVSASDSLRLPQIAAIGPATARAVVAAGWAVALVPAQAVAESLTETLLPSVLQPDGTPTRFLLVRAEQARDHLPDTLRVAGAEVVIAPAYRTVIPEGSVPAIRELFSKPENYPDAITFTSSSTAHNLFALLEAAGLKLPPDILRVSIGPITSQTLTQLGFPAHIEAKEPNVPSLVAAVVDGLR